MRVALPFAVLDFEASSLGSDSYPIEVGVAIARASDTIEIWSTLIRPHPDWAGARWDRNAEQVHGIALDALSEGVSAAEALTRLNELLAPIGHAWCDGGGFDGHWFQRLCKAAPLVRPQFRLWDISGLFALDRRAHNRFADALSGSEAPHRAGPDAARVCGAVLTASKENRREA